LLKNSTSPPRPILVNIEFSAPLDSQCVLNVDIVPNTQTGSNEMTQIRLVLTSAVLTVPRSKILNRNALLHLDLVKF
jgi:hypothetical protein